MNLSSWYYNEQLKVNHFQLLQWASLNIYPVHWSKLLGREKYAHFISCYIFPQSIKNGSPVYTLVGKPCFSQSQAGFEVEGRGLSSLPSLRTTQTISATRNSRHRELAVPTERGARSYWPRGGVNRLEWAKLATPKVRVAKKMLLRHQESLPS